MKKLKRNVLLGMALTAASGLSASAVSADAAGQPGGSGGKQPAAPGISVVSSMADPGLNPVVYGPPEWFQTDPEEETFAANEDVYGPPEWFQTDPEEETFAANEGVYGPPAWFDNVTPIGPMGDAAGPAQDGKAAGFVSPFRLLARMIAFLGSFLRFLYHGR